MAAAPEDGETGPELALAGVAAAIGEPARARMLCTLLDGRARTGTELAAVAEIAASTASAHLKRLEETRLVTVRSQGRHRYYALGGARVARVLEMLGVLAGGGTCFTPTTPERLRLARSCYDHLAGALGVALHDRLLALGWLDARAGAAVYELRAAGQAGLSALGVDWEAARTERRRFAYGCLDWSERRPHLAGALGAAVLDRALRAKWVGRALEGRELGLTGAGRRVFASLGLDPQLLAAAVTALPRSAHSRSMHSA